MLVLLFAAYKTMGAIVVRWAHRFGFSDIADVASLPLLLLVTSLFSLLIALQDSEFRLRQRPQVDGGL